MYMLCKVATITATNWYIQLPTTCIIIQTLPQLIVVLYREISMYSTTLSF